MRDVAGGRPLLAFPHGRIVHTQSSSGKLYGCVAAAAAALLVPLGRERSRCRCRGRGGPNEPSRRPE